MNKSKNSIGTISLYVVAGVVIVLVLLMHIGVLKGAFWQVIKYGLEAALVGSLADWYAVTVLFHKAPFPMRLIWPFKDHQEIVIKNRERITNNIVELVQKKWLTPEAIKEHLQKISPSETFINHFSENGNQEQAMNVIRKMLVVLTEKMEDKNLESFLEKIIRDQLEGINLAHPIGKWIGKSIDQGRHEKLWEVVLESLNNSLHDPDILVEVVTLIKGVVQDWANKSSFTKVGLKVSEFFNLIKYELLASILIHRANSFVTEAKSNPNNSIRIKVNENLRRFAAGLENGNPEAVSAIEPLQDNFSNHLELKKFIEHIMVGFKKTMEQQLVDNKTDFMVFVQDFLFRLLNDLKVDYEKRKKLDETLRHWISQVVERNHHLIGQIVSSSLSPEKLSDEDLVLQIEEKVSSDLQWIRLNGAVMGFIVGLVIGILNYFI